MGAELSKAVRRVAHSKVAVRGLVQGVGFRPFVVRIARQHCIRGNVWNEGGSVRISASGERAAVEEFLFHLRTCQPVGARIDECVTEVTESDEPAECLGSPPHVIPFQIGFSRSAQGECDSELNGRCLSAVPLDTAICDTCREEMLDASNRRYRYPFISCASCGPRYSILESMPFDRESTSMSDFQMCGACAEEYADPSNRRFHAQTISCLNCGPALELWQPDGDSGGHDLVARGDAAWLAVISALKAGKIVAMKGVGGFQLVVRADCDWAVNRLRVRKGRLHKPFAVQIGTVAAVRSFAEVGAAEEQALLRPERPIVLLRKLSGREAVTNLSASVCQGVGTLAVMLPASGLHELLTWDLSVPLVVTSGNRHGELMAVGNSEAIAHLGAVADCILLHTRRIVNRVDDSVVRILGNEATCIRMGRGYAPYLFSCPHHPSSGPEVSVAFGGHHLASAAVGFGSHVIIGPHIGDWGSPEVACAHREQLDKLMGLFGLTDRLSECKPSIFCDAHPDCHSTLAAEAFGVEQQAPRLVRVAHHQAHAAVCLAEAESRSDGVKERGTFASALHVVWDGFGYGEGGEARGAEFYFSPADDPRFYRVGYFRPLFSLGGDSMAREPRRSALAVLLALFGRNWSSKVCLPRWSTQHCPFSPLELRLLQGRLAGSLARSPAWKPAGRLSNGPPSVACVSSAGRLIDAAAALMGLTMVNQYEGHAALLLESLAVTDRPFSPLGPFAIRSSLSGEMVPPGNGSERNRSASFDWGELELDWAPVMQTLVSEIQAAHLHSDAQSPWCLRGEFDSFLARLCSRFLDALAGVVLDVCHLIGAKVVCLSGGVFQNRHLHDRLQQCLGLRGVDVRVGRRLPPNDAGLAAGQILHHRLMHPCALVDAERR
jgi:hydrogenase maturation protein HypF